MKNILFLSVVTVIAVFMLSPRISFSQQYAKSSWIYVKTIDGVEIYWRWIQELKDQFRHELKFVNTNPYKVQVRWKPYFKCPDGRKKEYTEIGAMDDIKPGGTKAGQWQGLFYYPCDGTAATVGGVQEFQVKKLGATTRY